MAIEDFTTYTELDLGGDLTVTAPKIDISTVKYGQDDSIVHKDFGANYFDDWTFEFDCEHTQAEDKSGFQVVIVSNTVNEWYQLWVGYAEAVGIQLNRGSTGNMGLILRDCGNHNTDSYVHSLNVQYWCTFTRSGVTCTLYIYTNAARTVLVDTLTIDSEDVDYRYMLAYAAMNYSTETKTSSGYIQNLNLDAADISAGIKIWDGSAYIELVQDDTSPVRMYTGSETIGIKLVAIDDADASAIRIYDGATTKAFKKKV